MKKILLLAAVLSVCSAASAQRDFESEVPERHYIHLGYAWQTLELDEWNELRSKEGAAFEAGSTFFFHARRPILGMARIGLDFSYFDLQVARFMEELVPDNRESYWANIGMQVGPSVTVTPMDEVHGKVYVHYAPSFNAFLPERNFDTVYGGYAGHVTAGLEASWRFLSLGVETRWGTSKWSGITESGDEEGYSEFDDKQKIRLPSTRLMIGFRF